MRRVFATASAKFRRKASTKSMHILYAYAIQVLFLFLPTISRRIGQALQECVVFDAGDGGKVRYLAADLSINCDDNEYYDAMYYYAFLMLVLYPIGVPFLLFVMMWAVRDRMHPGGLSENATIDKREDDHLYDEEPITAFARIYRPYFWWYEVYNMMRRLALTCMVLAYESLSSQTIFVLSISVVTLVIERESSPYINPYLSSFCYLLHWQIVLFILGFLLLDAEMTKDAGATAISAVLMAANICLILVVLVDTRAVIKMNAAAEKEGEAEAEGDDDKKRISEVEMAVEMNPIYESKWAAVREKLAKGELGANISDAGSPFNAGRASGHSSRSSRGSGGRRSGGRRRLGSGIGGLGHTMSGFGSSFNFFTNPMLADAEQRAKQG